MSRIDCLNGTQRAILEEALSYHYSVAELANICHVHPRTMRDWRHEKHRMTYESLKRVCEHVGVPLPTNLRILPEFWHIREAGRLGGQRHFQLYGAPPATLESRRKGGLISSQRFRDNPELAKALGFRLRQSIRRPRESAMLAEFVGIMLGDGCLSSRFQVGISFNTKTDEPYGLYLQKLFRVLFNLSATISARPGSCDGRVTASSRALVEFLETKGLIRGDKVRLQVGLPQWIWRKQGYQRACLRGLMDTDGSIYGYTHRVYGHTYRHMALSFTNRSQPLLTAVERVLKYFGFHPRMRRYQVSLYRGEEVVQYFHLVGSHNRKHCERFRSEARLLGSGRGTQVDDGDRLESD